MLSGLLASTLNFTAPACFVTTETLSQRLAPCAVALEPTAPLRSSEGLGADDTGTWKLSFDDTSAGARQKIDGFGAAWTDATVTVFDALDAAAQKDLLSKLFSPSDGIGLSLMRHTIGQSDLTPSSIGRWSFDENSGDADVSLSAFNLTEPGRRMLDWLQRMRAVASDVKLLGSPWSPPGWMKQDNTLRWEYVDAWVDYFVRYLREYAAAGVRVDAITIQNEPLHSADGAWTTMLDASYQGILVSRLGATLLNASIPTEIWAYDHNTDRVEVPQHVVDTAAQYVGGVAWHCYAGAPTDDSVWSPMSAFHAKNPSVPQYMTECWTHLSTGEAFFDLPAFIGGPVRNYGAGALAWTLGGSSAYDVSYPGGCAQCSGIVQVDMPRGTATYTQDYYTLGQFSKFVPRGAVYHESAGSYIYPDGTGVQATAFIRPSGERIIVIENKIRSDLNLTLTFSTGDAWVGMTPQRSVSTWILPAHTEMVEVLV